MKKQYVNAYARNGTKEKIVMAILTGICIAAALITFVVVSIVGKSPVKEKNVTDIYDKSYNTGAVQSEVAVVEPSEEEKIEITEEVSASVSKEPIATHDASGQDKSRESTSVSDGYCAPCTGRIIQEYSPATPLYSPTLDDWRVHNGIDIFAVLGEDVRAVNDGQVYSVTNDLRYGFTVVVSHADGNKSVYSNLQHSDMVKEGDKVKKGDIIAHIGDTALFETVADTHLHFEMINENGYVNPLDYFSIN